MESLNERKGLGVLRVLTAGVLVLIVSGCEQKPVSRDADRMVELDLSKAAKKVDPAIRPVNNESRAAVKDNGNVKLAARIKEILMKDPALKDATIDVKASDGLIELFGTVAGAASRGKAGQIASNVPGVKTVKNYLAIVKGS